MDQPNPKRPNSSLALRSDSAKAFGQTPLASFDPLRFPTNSNVLCRFIYERELSKQRPKKDITKQIYSELVDIYNKGLDIPKPTKKDFLCEKQIIKIYDDWCRAAQYQKENRMASHVNLFVNDLPKMLILLLQMQRSKLG